ncbi:MAG: hypothetical protein ACREFP_02035 [Acetobacteraceae bacterium]
MRSVKVAWPIGGRRAVVTVAGGGGPRLHCRLAIAIVAAFCCVACLLIPAARAAETLHPATALPEVKAVSAEDYYILLLKWTRNVVVKGVTARVVYLDPPLYLAWLKQTNPHITQQQFAKALAGFPRVLTFRTAYQAASRKFLDASAWKVALLGENGKPEPAKSGHSVAPASLESNEKGTYWQEEWLYTFDVPAGFLSAHTAGLRIALAGPEGSGTADWQFGAVRVKVTHPDAYVPYLGVALLAFSGIVIAGLVLTRRPRRSFS